LWRGPWSTLAEFYERRRPVRFSRRKEGKNKIKINACLVPNCFSNKKIFFK